MAVSIRFELLTSSILSILLQCAIVAAQCNTDQNPTCAGVAAFEALCCPYPSVCYWQDRYATPGCCAAGQVCLTSGGTTIVPAEVQSYPYTTITSTYQITSTVEPVPVTSTVTQNPVVTITSTTNAVTPVVIATSTVSQNLVQSTVNTANAVVATGSQAWTLRPRLTVMCIIAVVVAYFGS